MTSLRLSVLIPTHNRAAQLATTLAPLLHDEAIHELLVVDDRSTDGTVDLLTRLASTSPRLRILRSEGAGKGDADQAGLAAATGDVVLLLDDDVVAAPGLAAGHLAHHERRPGLVVVGYMPLRPVPRRGGMGPSLVYAQDYERVCNAAEADPGGMLLNLWGGNVSLRTEDVRQVGLTSDSFDPRWRHIDRELGFRCLEAGLEGVFDRRLRATHHYERSLAQYIRDARWQATGLVHLHRSRAAVLGPLTIDYYLGDLSRPRAAVVRLAATRWGHRPTVRGLESACRLAGRLDRVDEEIVLTRLLRRAEQAYHVQRLLSGGAGGSDEPVG